MISDLCNLSLLCDTSSNEGINLYSRL